METTDSLAFGERVLSYVAFKEINMDELLTDATDEQLALAVEANGVECCLSWARWPRMERLDNEFLTTTMTDVPFPFFNNVFYPRIPDGEIDAVIDSVVDDARKRNVPMFWWTGPTTKPEDLGERLLQKGFEHGFEAPAMAMDLRHMNENGKVPSGLVIQEVTDDKMLKDWCDVMAPVYGFPDFAAKPWFEMLAHLGLGTDQLLRHYVGYLNDQPVASASLYLDCGVGGISSVATHPDFRHQGFGTAITVEPLREARRLGYRYGVLFSSAMGLGVYNRIGFREYGKGNCYVWSNE
jgi:GNAT superfamily N-acetyltransferase